MKDIKDVKVGDIIKQSLPCYPRYIYLKVIEITKEFISNFGTHYVDCIVEEVGSKKLREGERGYRFNKNGVWIIHEKDIDK